MKKQILLINVCEQKLHYFEFVKPIENILKDEKKDFFTKHYLKLLIILEENIWKNK